MRTFAVLLLIALGACSAPEDELKLATVDAREGLGMNLRELPRATLSSIGQDFSRALAERSDGRLALLVRRGKTDLSVPLDVGRAPEGARKDGNRLPLRQPTDTLLRT
jgi:hypothetical protein